MNELIRIVLADDEELPRQGIKGMLENRPDMIVIEVVSEYERILPAVRERRPDLLLLDLFWERPDKNHIWVQRKDLISDIRQAWPGVFIVIITAFPQYEQEVLYAGANALLAKNLTGEALVETILSFFPDGESQALTDDEVMILDYIANGLTDKQIARLKNENDGVIGRTRQKIFSKLGAMNAPHAVRLGIRLKYIK